MSDPAAVRSFGYRAPPAVRTVTARAATFCCACSGARHSDAAVPALCLSIQRWWGSKLTGEAGRCIVLVVNCHAVARSAVCRWFALSAMHSYDGRTVPHPAAPSPHAATEFDAGSGCPIARELLTDGVLALIARHSPRLQVVRCAKVPVPLRASCWMD